MIHTHVFFCECVRDSPKSAQFFSAYFLVFVRSICFSADLYVKGNALILDTPDFDTTKALAIRLNDSLNNIR